MNGKQGQDALLSLIARACEARTFKKAVFSKPQDKAVKRMTLVPLSIGGRTVLQSERLMADNKALHENIPIEQTERLAAFAFAYDQINLITTVGECELRRSKGGKETLIGGEKLARALSGDVLPTAEAGGNNRKKQYILDGSEPFLKLLDVSDATGRVRDKKQAKFRQINRFLELVRDCEGHLPKEGVLSICDLCCGKSYLSFAVYHYFAKVLGRTVRMVGVDLKPDVVAYCNSVAQKLGFDGLSFVCGDVGAFEAERPVHLVVSLHACDTATDLVLDRALAFGAEVILSTPCCHHELNHTLNCPALSFIAEHSMLRQKLCDAATDALRLKRLEAEGYTVCALELIDPEETPKNIMLRALKRRGFDKTGAEATRLASEYREAERFLLGK